MIVGGGPDYRVRVARRWRRLFVAGTALCLLVFAVNVAVSEVSSGNWWGLSYVIAASVLMLGAMALGARRRTMRTSSRLHLGRSRAWLHFHVYGGLLSLLLVLMHAEFRLPVGVVTTWLFWLSLATISSGLFGLVLQKWIPRALSSGLSTEVLYERIPELVESLKERATQLLSAGSCGDAIQNLYAESIEPEMRQPTWRWVYLFDVSGGVNSRVREFAYVKRFLAADEAPTLDELERLYRGKLEIDAHYTLQWALRTWHWLHVPVSILLFGFLAVHILSVYYW
jgi:hypothetical protein